MRPSIVLLIAGLSVGALSCGNTMQPANCTAANCFGCCNAAGKCEVGNMSSACGKGGQMCQVCMGTSSCNLGACSGGTGGGSSGTGGGTSGTGGGTSGTGGGTSGTGGGTSGTGGGTSGTGGGTSGTGGGTSGTGGGTSGTGGGTANVCDSLTCGTGCCIGTTCLPYSNQSSSLCGTGGAACAACPGGGICSNGTCPPSCTTANCANGCCLGTTCVPFANQTTNACGANAATCIACPNNGTCTNGTCPSSGCNATTCANGCCSNGICTPAAMQSVSACGTNGAACQQCPTGNSCIGGSCVTTATVGSSCTSTTDCAVLGTNATCKSTTDFGGGVYPGGYCSKDPCDLSTNVCPAGSTCVNLGLSRGEQDPICAANCATPNTQSTCRTGYTCLGPLTGGGGVCWLASAPVITPNTTADKVGQACTSDTQCINPPNSPFDQTGFCYPETNPQSGAPTGYNGGYCLADCSEFGDALCGSKGICLLVDQASGFYACLQQCPAPYGGQSICRSGYVCGGLIQGDGGLYPTGICDPSCFSPNNACSTDRYCDAGYCLNRDGGR